MSKSNISVGTKIWADKINAAWQASVDGIFKVGQVLVQAKEALPQRDFERLLDKELRFHGSVARKLIIIAEDERLCAHAHKLPASWTTLYELSKLSDDELEKAIEAGTISETTQRAEVQRLRAPKPKPTVTDADYQDVEDPERAAVVDPEPKPPEPKMDGVDGAGSSSETNARQSVPAAGHASGPVSGDKERANPESAGEAGGSPALYPPREGVTPIWVDPTNSAEIFAVGFTMARTMALRLPPVEAVRGYPEHMPLMSDEITAFWEWLDKFEAAYRERYGNGNEAALAAE